MKLLTMKTWGTSYFTEKKLIVILILVLASVLMFWKPQKPSTKLDIHKFLSQAKREQPRPLSETLVKPIDRLLKMPSTNKPPEKPIKIRERPWFLSNGTAFPKPAKFSKELGRRDAKLLPFEDPDSDRFENQLMFVPPNYYETRGKIKNKTILIYNGMEGWWDICIRMPTWFSDHKCPVDTCNFSMNKSDIETADMIFFGYQYRFVNATRSPHQVYALYVLESPKHYSGKFANMHYNWTITYRHDSTIPIPYYKWIYYDPRVTHKLQTQNFAQNRTKKVAWLVSNCKAHNDRNAYVRELQKHIDVDVYGKCGTMNCTDSDTDKCLTQLSKDYKFYLSFENSHCLDYITEKVYRNALEHTMLPIVMGARKGDYERQLPYNSFIYVEDFATPKDLAEYLHTLDRSDDLYNSYFQWKGTGELVNKFSHLWCRMCALLHDDYTMQPRWYEDINKWWFDPDTVRNGFWRGMED